MGKVSGASQEGSEIVPSSKRAAGTAADRLRHSKFVGLRADKNLEALLKNILARDGRPCSFHPARKDSHLVRRHLHKIKAHEQVFQVVDHEGVCSQ